MIFSTDNCPICNSKLKLDIIEADKGKVAFLYSCHTRAFVRNDTNTATVATSHYENRCWQGGELSFMVIPPYELMHSSAKKITKVRIVSHSEPKKIIFEVPLLDIDYSQTHVVVNKIKLLTVFS